MLGYSSVCLFCLFIGLSAGLHTSYYISLKLRGGLLSAQNRTQYLLFILVRRIYLIYNFTVSLSGYTEIHLQEVYTQVRQTVAHIAHVSLIKQYVLFYMLFYMLWFVSW